MRKNNVSKLVAASETGGAAEERYTARAIQIWRLTSPAGDPTKGRLMSPERGRRMIRFADRGLSGRTIAGLIKAGIDLPERVLFMREAELRALPGIGKTAFVELVAYRARFMVR